MSNRRSRRRAKQVFSHPSSHRFVFPTTHPLVDSQVVVFRAFNRRSNLSCANISFFEFTPWVGASLLDSWNFLLYFVSSALLGRENRGTVGKT